MSTKPPLPRRFSRKAWGARAPRGRVRLDPREVIGLALHWPAIKQPLSNPQRVMSALRAIQAGHMDTDQIADGGASDIAYQVAVDQQGNRYRLRDLRYRSAANGGTEVNDKYGAVLLMLAIGEKPTQAMIRTVRNVVDDFDRIYPHYRELVGHGDIRPTGPTECPGPYVRELIADGSFEQTGRGPR